MSVVRKLPRPGKSATLLIGAVLFGLAAVLATRSFIHKSIDSETQKYKVKAQTIDIVVAKRNLPAGTVISEDVMAIRQMPRDFVSNSMIRPDEFAKANGSRLQADMRPGDPLLWPLLERWDAATFSGRIAQGVRALTIPVDDTNSVAGMIHPGDLIDLYLTAKAPDLPGGAKAMGGEQTFMLLQAMKVMATGQSVKADKTVSTKQGNDQNGYSSITLSVTPDQAQRIMVAQKAGAFRIALRNPNDDAPVHSRSMDAGTLFGDNPTVQHTGSLAEIIVGGRGISRSWQAVNSTAPNAQERAAQMPSSTLTQPAPALPVDR